MPGLKRRKRKRVSPDPSPATAGPAEAPVGGPAPAKRRKLAQPKSTPMEDEEEILAASSEDSEAEVRAGDVLLLKQDIFSEIRCQISYQRAERRLIYTVSNLEAASEQGWII